MAQLRHDSEGFLQGEGVELSAQTEFLNSISKDIAVIRAAIKGMNFSGDRGTQSIDATDAVPSNNSSTTNYNYTPVATPNSRHQSESNPRNQIDTINQSSVTPESTPESTGNRQPARVLLGSLETATATLSDIQIDLSSTANSLQSIANNQQSSTANSNQNRVNRRENLTQSSEVNNEEPQRQEQSTHNIRANNTSGNHGNIGNVNQPVAQQSNRIRDENGRFIGGNQGGRNQAVSEPKTKNGRDASGRFSGNGESGGLGKGRGGEAGFISRLASGIGSVVSATKDEVTDEKIDPIIGAFKEVAEPIAKVGGAALSAGKTLFSGAKSVFNFLPNFKKKDSDSEAAPVPAPVPEITAQSPAAREVRTPPARIDETTTANPTLRVRDSQGRFVSNNPQVSQTSTRQTGSDLIQNNAPRNRVAEPSRNTIIGENPSVQSAENTQQTAQSEPPVVGTSRRSFFGLGGNSNRQEKVGKLSLSRAIKEILSSRKEQSIYNKASLKLLKVIANKETSAGSSDSGGGFFSGLMGGLIPMVIAGLGALVAGVVGVFTGIGGMLLTGVTGALGVIFSPIGLAIAAAGALAWGLFTEDGQKFFASIGEYISKCWDATTGFITENFSGVIETAKQFWSDLSDSFAPITKVAGDLFDGLTKTWKDITDTISGIFDTFSTFLKDKFGIDIPAIAEKVFQPVADAAEAVVSEAKDAGNKIADGAKNAYEGAKDLAGKAVEGTKNAVDNVKQAANPVYESAKKSVKDGTVLKDTAAGAKSVATNTVEGAKKVGGKAWQGIKDAGSWVLGQSSKLFESGKGGAGTVSSGAGDHGGASYGTYQLSSSQGSVDSFLKKSGYAKQFEGLKVGSSEFNEKWKETAKTDGNFETAQHDYAKQTYFDPQHQKLQKAGIDLTGRGKAVQDAVWSTGVQFGGTTSLIEKALKDKDVSKLSDKEIVSSIQDYKLQNNDKLFSKSSDGVRKGTANRATKEKENLLALADAEEKAKQTGKTDTTQTALASAETALEKLSPITSAQASETPANNGKLAPEIAAQAKGQDYFLGDSIAHGYRGKGEGDTVVGRNPAKILESMQKNLAENPEFYKGKNVHLSTGMSNNTGDTKSIEAQMKLLKESGANTSVYGVADNFKGDSKVGAGLNKNLADLSTKYGANFTGGFEASKDTVHPKSYSKDPSKNAEAQKSVDAGLKPEALAKANEPTASIEPAKSSNAPIMTHESLPMLSSDGTGLTHSTTHTIKASYDTDMKGNKTKAHVETPEEKEKAYTDARWAQTNSYNNGDHNSTDPAVKANFEALKAKADKLDPEYVAPAKIPNKSRFETNKSGTIEEDVANTDKYWAADIAEADAQSISTYNGQIVAKPQAETFAEANAPAISNYSKTGKIAKKSKEKKEAVAPIESPAIEPVDPSESESYKTYNADKNGMTGYAMQDDGEGGMSKTNLETLEITPATPEEIASYQTVTPDTAIGATQANESTPVEMSASTTVDGSVTYENVPEKTPEEKAARLAARNTPEKIAERKADNSEKERQKGERYKPKDDKVNVENEPPLIADIKSRMPEMPDVAGMAQGAMDSLPDFATNALSGMASGGIGGGIGAVLSGGMPSFMKDPVSTISKSISMPSLPKMPSMPAVAESPAVKEPLGSSDSRSNSAVSQPSADIGQDMADKRLAHIVSGGYSRG